MAKLIIARHGESLWNKLGQWTGSRDINLTEDGFKKSEEMGVLIKDINIDQAFASMQVRSIETLTCMLNACNLFSVPTVHSSALNERDYGDYTGKNKWDVEKLIGEKAFQDIRRGWDCPVSNGETLKMVYERAVPFYKENIVPLVNEGKNVLIVSHGNTIRALMKYIENIPEEKMTEVEMLFGQILIYDIDHEGHMISKEVRK